MVGFRTPQVPDNGEGWGPTTVPEELKDVPYAPFGKGDKLGRVSDFTQQGHYNKQYSEFAVFVCAACLAGGDTTLRLGTPPAAVRT